MLKPATDSKPEAAAPARPELRVFRPDNPYVALGLAVSYLMTKPAFADCASASGRASWSARLTASTITSCSMPRTRSRIPGVGVTSKDKAESWIEGRGGLSYDEVSFDGPSIIFNAWVASNSEVNRFLLQEARKITVGKEMVYFKRHYKDGSTRPMRLRVNDFVAQHLEQKTASAD